MSYRGYIALYRKIQDNFLWKQRRVFSKAEAWIDILMEAQHSTEPKEVLLGMKVLPCHYGQCLKSVKTWAKRWHWSRDKVHRYFKLLASHGMIDTRTEHVTTRVTVCNYGRYDVRQDGVRTPLRQHSERVSNVRRTQPDTDNNDNNDKNEKNVNGKTFSSSNKLKTFEQMQIERAEQAMAKAGKEFLADDEG